MKKKSIAKNLLKSLVVIVCIIGFLWQTLEFYFLYQTYPTVVDIQVSVPSDIEVPGITLCSSAGLKPEVICELHPGCRSGDIFRLVNPCNAFPDFCDDGVPPPEFTAVRYKTFMESSILDPESLERLRLPLNDFITCTITGAGEDRACDTENVVIASYYSDSNVPSFCFTLNSKWGNPNRETEMMKKSERIQLEFYIDISYRNRSAPPEEVQRPKYNPVGNPTVQLGLHSQKMTQSPFMFGKVFSGGKKYQIKVTKDEKHLLAPPYQTNCTDYMKDWFEKGGLAPLNQVMTVQECKLNAAYKEIGCIPYSIDYPHNYNICRYCEDCPNEKNVGSSCNGLLQSKNQPCDSESYNMNVEEKWVYVIRSFNSRFMSKSEDFYVRQKGFNCTQEKLFTKQCQTINIEINFDEYEVTNVTYNPKFETLELLSVVGGYMGMYLGISLVAVYEFLEVAAIAAYAFFAKSRMTKIKHIRRRLHPEMKESSAYLRYPSKVRQRNKREIY